MLEEALRWISAAMVVSGALTISSHGGPRRTGFGVLLMTIASVGWVCVGLMSDEFNLVAQNGVLFFVNAWGVWRYLLRRGS